MCFVVVVVCGVPDCVAHLVWFCFAGKMKMVELEVFPSVVFETAPMFNV